METVAEPTLQSEAPYVRWQRLAATTSWHHHSCSNLAQAVGDEEGDGDEAVVADPGEPLEAPLEPNRLHQINLQAWMQERS